MSQYFSSLLVPDNTPPADRLKANFAVSRTRYVLGKEFAALDALGISDMISGGISYPVVRSQQTNLYASMTLQRKELMDFYRTTETKLQKSSTAGVFAVNFDLRDSFAGGGLTYGALTYTVGNMSNLNDFANTVGEFKKTSLDLVRIQSLSPRFSAFFKYSGQFTRKNLDSSEDLFLGGANAVRAYPQGEGAGDSGYFTQVELRYTDGAYSPYVFYDSGRVSVYAEPTDTLPADVRKLAGVGLGLRYNRDKFSLDVSAAWRKQGGKPVADMSSDPKPRVTGTAGYRF
ncbi:ShlB/FhaC/HecB family hemolysin secretion/activation protein [Limnohabitans sp. DM1]|uniref:ShlB/FhaC/HecB family hemolysin secretion/activation protein n=1 Tax=Limnohabitans sp. DM1 TaxID=1597955 RepID=UPI000AA98480|nr:ShlB/FhaC/HecB family hemolysin secretion/activation protein [Limnohabitans sp. DM1]